MTREEIIAALERIADDLTPPQGRSPDIAAAAYRVGRLLGRLEHADPPAAREASPLFTPSDHAVRVLTALEAAGRNGLTLTQVRRAVFGGHVRAGELRPCLQALRDSGQVRVVRREDTGRPTTVFFLTEADPPGVNHAVR